jgi:hypothetical protein
MVFNRRAKTFARIDAAFVVDIDKHDNTLLAIKSFRDIAITGSIADNFGNRRYGFIAFKPIETAIDLLEMLDINDQQQGRVIFYRPAGRICDLKCS